MYHSNLVAFRRREEWHVQSREEAEERLLEGQRDVPIELVLLSGLEVSVYPKSLDALLWFRSKDWLVGWIAARIEALREASDRGELAPTDVGMDPPKLITAASERLSLELGRMASEACREGSRLSEAPENPFLEDLDPLDVVRIHRAFVEVNGGRLTALEAIVKPPKPGAEGRPMSWNVFYSTLGRTMKIPAKELMTDHSVVGLLASARLGAPEAPDLEEMTDE